MMKPAVVPVTFGACAVAWCWSSSVCGSEPDVAEHLRSKSHQHTLLTTDRTSAEGDGTTPPKPPGAVLGPCDANCDYCWCGTEYEQNCPIEWSYDADCDCGCQFCDPMCPDCEMQGRGGEGDLPDLIVQSSSRSPATGIVPGDPVLGMVSLADAVLNQGTSSAGSAFWGTWFISEDMTMTTSDYEWAYHEVACCLAPGESASASGDVPWPNSVPHNTLGQTYYIAVMADDLDEVTESDETNNWGEVWSVVLAGVDFGCPGDGDCCLDNGTPRCDDEGCCNAVCAQDTFCCLVQWDNSCANRALTLCPELCPGHPGCPGDGDCCQENGTPGCDDVSCCQSVCTQDTFCCEIEWSQSCADLAENSCPALCGNQQGCPGSGDCCFANTTPGCTDAACCNLVCAEDAFCCLVVWDDACADRAENLCPSLCAGNPACPGVGDCCSPNGTPSCQDTACCNTVCTIDSFCCNTEWDAVCAILAEDNCSALCPGFDADIYEPDDTPAAATDVSCGQTQTHSIDINGDVDWFAASLEVGGMLTVETFNLAGANPDTVLELYDSSCALLASDDDGGSELWASRLAWTAAYTGTHYVKARTYGGEVDHCDDQGGGPKSCLYDINFSCAFCCDPPFQSGDRVRLLVDNPNDAPNLPAETCGSVVCCDSDEPDQTIMVSWDSWTEGHNGDSYCDTTPAPYPDGSGWWMACDQMVHDETCGSCTPPLPPADPTPPDEAAQVPLDTTLCWNTTGQTAKVIYGADDRLDVYQVSDPSLLSVTDSTVAVVSKSVLIDNGDGTYSLPTTPTFAQAIHTSTGFPLCASEPFASQPVPAFCSGFLVAEDLLATAGHCITSAGECASAAFVFGFEMVDASTPVLTYPTSDVYFCDEIVDRVQDPTGPDWGVIRVDRPVVGHIPLPIRRTGMVPTGESLVLIGHPVGLPTKIAGGATVRDNSAASFFQANVDAYGGNSGSAVLNATTFEVEGVLARGNPDFILSGGCVASNQCPDSGCPTWESATRVTEFADLIPPFETLEYEVSIRRCNEVDLLATAVVTDTCWTPPTLEASETYCWQVIARNDCGETEGPVWTFTTAYVGACCQDGFCTEAFFDDCVSSGGAYVGDDTTCEGDTDGDGVDGVCGDECPTDDNKVTPGICGCGTPDDDTDDDGVADCEDGCPNDPQKTSPGVCGCGVSDDDTDIDSIPDCNDQCPGEDDRIDNNGDGIPDCLQHGIPAVSQWGLLVTALLMLVTHRVQSRRRVALT